MQINKINSQPNFKAVNQKYFEWAKKDYARGNNVSTEWLHRLSYDVFLFKEISPRDGVDTVEAVKKYMNKAGEGLEDLLQRLKKASQ